MQEGYTGNTHTCVTTKDCEKSVKVMEREKGGRHERKRKGERRKKKNKEEEANVKDLKQFLINSR